MAIDDSESMADCGAGALALAAMTTVASGLTQLEAGQLAVARFVMDYGKFQIHLYVRLDRSAVTVTS